MVSVDHTSVSQTSVAGRPMSASCIHHRLRGSASPGSVNGDWEWEMAKFFDPHRMMNLHPLTDRQKFVTGD